ncbi:hypothetical protein N2488_10440 [SAR92 clade bacterium H231]|nr:hypothetical protein [SAR92 clade bacterium H231]
MKLIIIASPHSRYDVVAEQLITLLPDYQIRRIRLEEELDYAHLTDIEPEWIFFPHWSWTIPRNIHENFNCVVFHMTDLPYGRGGSPLQNLIVRGHNQTRLSALKCTTELDAGPVYIKMPLDLYGTAEDIFLRAAGLMAPMIVNIIEQHLQPIEQIGEVVEFVRRKSEDGNIAALDSMEKIYNYIRMLDGEGYPRAFLEIHNFKLEFNEASFKQDELTAVVKFRRKDYE